MNFNEISQVWTELESRPSSKNKSPVKFVCPDSLFRIFLGLLGEPAQRAVLFEIPSKNAKIIEKFSIPNGINCLIKKTKLERLGNNSSCILISSSYENNAIFTLVLSDIILKIQKENTSDAYLYALKERLQLWKEFFKTQPVQKLTREAEVGLFGELYFLKLLLNKGIHNAVAFWNGPLKTAQDFQFGNFAIEIKSTLGSATKVNIASEEQLDSSGIANLYLGFFNMRLSVVDGLTLPELVEEIEQQIPANFVEEFQAKLVCVGFNRQDVALYTDRFEIQKSIFFGVTEDFPRTVYPKCISHIRYELDLAGCRNFVIDSADFFDILTRSASAV